MFQRGAFIIKPGAAECNYIKYSQEWNISVPVSYHCVANRHEF